jgi:hypothetical protein
VLDTIPALRTNTAEGRDGEPPGNTAEKNFIEFAAAFFGMDAKAIARTTEQVQT